MRVIAIVRKKLHPVGRALEEFKLFQDGCKPK
jgi:hypothetical protein